MDIYIESQIPERDGTVTVCAMPSDTIMTLIEAYCRDRHIRIHPQYLIKSQSGRVLPKRCTISEAGLHPSAIVYMVHSINFDDLSRSGRFRMECNHWWVLACATLLIGGCGLIAVAVLRLMAPIQPYEYGIVFDAGSTHTRMFIYKWSGTYVNGTAIVRQIDKCDAPKLTSRIDDPKTAGSLLISCLEKARDVIPEKQHSTSHVYLGATAGLRMLRETYPLVTELMLQSIRYTLSRYPFLLRNETGHIRVLSGMEEGTYGWVTANYLGGNLYQPEGSTDSKTFGALDLGGASAQITFIPGNAVSIPSDYQFNVRLYGTNYTIYSHSFLCYGVDEAWRRLLAHVVMQSPNHTTFTNPCAPMDNTTHIPWDVVFEAPCAKGPHAQHAFGEDVQPPSWLHKDTILTFEGSSDPAECSKFVESLFNFTFCTTSNCSFNGVYQPELHGEYLAFSMFYYMVDFLNVTSSDGLHKYVNASHDLCLKNWDQVKDLPTTYPSGLNTFCFESLYILELLTQGYHFNNDNWNTLQFVEKIRKSEVGWSLGFMLLESNTIPEDLPTSRISILIFALLVMLFVFITIASIVIALYAKRYNPINDPDLHPLVT